MADEEKAARIKEVDEQINKLSTEYYQLVAPTVAESQEAEDLLWDDLKAEAECLLDPQSTLGRIYLADNALMYREIVEADNEKAE